MSDDYQSVTVAAARAAVQASGELEGIEGPLYLPDAIDSPEWVPYFSKVLFGESGHPEFAKVIVTRKGQKPREVVIAWDEYADQMDADPEWDALRASKPNAIFGAEVERHAYRVVFADVLAPLAAPRRPAGEAPQSWGAVDAPPVRDWRAEIADATPGALEALLDEARAAGAVAADPGLQSAFMDRLLQLEQKPKPTPKPTPAPAATKPERPQGDRRRRKR